MSDLINAVRLHLRNIENTAEDLIARCAPTLSDVGRYADTIKAHVASAHDALNQSEKDTAAAAKSTPDAGASNPVTGF